MADRPQMPAPPEGCVYGPWWDGVISRWLAITPTPSGAPHYWTHQWTGSDWCPYSSSERELLRLAKENAELRASQPSENDRAVVWLMKECAWHVARWGSDPAKWKVAHIADDHYWIEDINPVEEARKLGWGG